MEGKMIPNYHKCSLIVFEGVDGSGKSQEYSRLQTFMRAYHPQVGIKYTKEPDKDRPIGQEVYSILNGTHPNYQLERMAPYHFQAFYIEDRMGNYRENIIPALQSGIHVVQDRGVASSVCYGAKSPDEFYDFMGLHNRVFSAAQVPFIWPNLIIIFDVPVEVALERMRASGKVLDKFEDRAKLELARANYLAFARTYPNCIVVDGQPDPQQVFVEVKKIILPLMGITESSGA